MSRLWELCRDGKTAEVRSSLARGEDVNEKNSIGRTALLLALENKHNSIVKMLLDQPAVDVFSSDLGTYFQLCKRQGKGEQR